MRRADLLRFQRKLGALTFFDPACGCGNFLIIAYRELRVLELEVLKELYAGPMLETLADIYDSDLMPATLRRAHQRLDRAVDRLYRRERFKSENDRLEHLFGLYERMRAPLVTEAVKQGRRRRRRPTTPR